MVELGKKVSFASHQGEGMLLDNPRSSVMEGDLVKLRYIYKIPTSIEVRAQEAHEMVDWVIPSWVALYEILFKDGMRLLI